MLWMTICQESVLKQLSKPSQRLSHEPAIPKRQNEGERGVFDHEESGTDRGREGIKTGFASCGRAIEWGEERKGAAAPTYSSTTTPARQLPFKS